MFRGDRNNKLAILFDHYTNLQIPKRLMLSLELLKRELAVATLQQKIGKQVEICDVMEREVITTAEGRRKGFQDAA